MAATPGVSERADIQAGAQGSVGIPCRGLHCIERGAMFNSNRSRLLSIPCVIAAVLCGCASSQTLIGTARPPISPEAVRLYSSPPAAKYEEIADLDASSTGSFAFSAQGKTDAVIMRLKASAAKLGANGIILQGLRDEAGASIGLGGGQDSYSPHSAVGVGVGGSFRLNRKAGSGVAIYVPTQ